MTAHTPWRNTRDNDLDDPADPTFTVYDADHTFTIYDADDALICENVSSAAVDVITAAPDLLAALITIVDGDMTTDAAAMAAADAARAAIAKATGQ